VAWRTGCFSARARPVGIRSRAPRSCAEWLNDRLSAARGTLVMKIDKLTAALIAIALASLAVAQRVWA